MGTLELVEAARTRWRTVSLDEPISPAPDAPTRGESLADPRPDALETIERDELRERVRLALAELPPRWATVIVCRFGLEGRESVTLDEVAGALGVSRQRTKQIEGKALAKLRGRLMGWSYR